MDRLRVQSHAAISLLLLVGRKWINKSFRLSWAFVINLHGLICPRNVSRVILRQGVLRVSVVGKAPAVRSSTSVRSVLRVRASPWQSDVPRIHEAGVAKSKSPAGGRTIATAVCHPWAVAMAVCHSYTLAAAAPHCSSLAASASASTAAATGTVTAAAAAVPAAGIAAPAAATTPAAGIAAAAATIPAAVATTPAAGTAAAAATSTTAAGTTAAASTTAAGTTATASAASAAASMCPDWIREDYRDRERQQEDKGGFHNILGGANLAKYQASAWLTGFASKLTVGFTFFALNIRLVVTVISRPLTWLAVHRFSLASLPSKEFTYRFSKYHMRSVSGSNLDMESELPGAVMGRVGRAIAKRTELIQYLGIPDKIKVPDCLQT
jgi:hypothetical protein